MKKRKLFLFLITSGTALVLVFSFGLHSIQIVHEHPGVAHHALQQHGDAGETEEGSTLLFFGEHMHHADKKLFLLLLAASVLLGFLISNNWRSFIGYAGCRYGCFWKRMELDRTQYEDAITLYVQKGLLHPKFH